MSTAPTLAPGDTLQLIASETVNSSIITLAPYNYVVHGGSTVATVSASGLLTLASGAVPGTTYTVTAQSSAGNISWQFVAQASLAQPVVIGTVLCQQISSGPVANVVVTAYDSSGNALATATTNASGTFSLAAPSNALYFGVSLTSVDQSSTTFYSLYGYGANDYDSSTPACFPLLPTLSTGNHRYALPYILYLNAHLAGGYTYPPPAPAGCLG